MKRMDCEGLARRGTAAGSDYGQSALYSTPFHFPHTAQAVVPPDEGDQGIWVRCSMGNRAQRAYSSLYVALPLCSHTVAQLRLICAATHSR